MPTLCQVCTRHWGDSLCSQPPRRKGLQKRVGDGDGGVWEPRERALLLGAVHKASGRGNREQRLELEPKSGKTGCGRRANGQPGNQVGSW